MEEQISPALLLKEKYSMLTEEEITAFMSCHSWLAEEKDQSIIENYLEDYFSYVTSQLLRVRQPHELTQIPLKQETRRTLLHAYETFYALHISDFGTMKTLPVLQAVLG